MAYPHMALIKLLCTKNDGFVFPTGFASRDLAVNVLLCYRFYKTLV